jgi:[NiFe] hydrogenase small subunit
MKSFVGSGNDGAARTSKSRRDFMKFCATIAAVMGMGPAFAPKVAQALTAKKKPTVVWLHNAECTGCSESVLRTVDPYIDEVVLDILNLQYHETIMAAAGHAAEKALHDAVHSPDGYIAVVEGGIPTAEDGIHGMVGGKTMYEINKEVLPGAKAVITIGSCANFGGIQKADPNPTKAKGVNEAMGKYGVNAINVAGCPPNPYNFIGTVVAFLTGKKIELDEYNRPVMFFGETVHDRCPRLQMFNEDKFASSFDSEEAAKGYCLYELGCKGPYTYNNCPTVKFNQTNWPIEAGHPCIACSEPEFWDEYTPFYEEV